MYVGENIVLKAVGKTVPMAYWDKAIAQYQGPFGMAVVDGKELKLLPLDNELMVEEALTELQDAYKDNSILFFMGDYKDSQADSTQPFTVLTDSADKPILSVFLKGTFEQFAQAGGSHSPAFYANNSFIIEELKDYYIGKCKNNLNNLMQMLREDQRLRNKLSMALSPQGFMVFMANTSEIIKIDHNSPLENFSFGWATNSCGYREDPVEVPKEPELPAKASILDRLKGVAKPATVAVAAAAATAVVSALIPEEKVVEPEGEFEEVEIKLPPQARSKNEKKDFWRSQLGFLPPDYLKITSFKMKRYPKSGEVIGEDGQKTSKGKVYQSFRDAMAAVGDGNRANKDVEPHHVKPATDTSVKAPVEPVAAVAKEVELSDAISSLSDMDRKAIAAQFLDGASVKKSLDLHSQVISDPAKMATSMGKIKTFTDEMSIKLEDTFKWDTEALDHLYRVSKPGLLLLIQQYRSLLPEYKNYIATARSTPAKQEEPVKQVAAEKATGTGGPTKRVLTR